MPAIITNAKNFLVNTDYPMDKVVYLTSGTMTVAASSFGTVPIAHGLPFIPLPKGAWTTSVAWDIVYEEQSGSLAGPNLFSPFLYGFSVTADATNININLTNFAGGPSVTIYYRIYCFEPTTSAADLAPTASSGSDFILNSDVNYTKLINSGYHDFSDTTGTTATHMITHGLGTIPQALFWIERSGSINQAAQSIYEDGITCQVSMAQAVFTSKESLPARIHWRIYADE